MGLSSGLEYDVGSYSSTEELIALSKAAAQYGGFYMTHSPRRGGQEPSRRSTRRIAISKQGGLPLDISHIKLATVGVWGQAKKAVALIDAARAKGQDVTADCYPYEAWHSNIEVLVPNKQYFDAKSVDRALADVGGADRVTITACKAHPDVRRRNLEEIAKSEGISTVDALLEDRQGRRRGRHRALDEDRGRRHVLPPAVGDGRHPTAASTPTTRAAPERFPACSAASCARSTSSRSRRPSAR